MRVVGGVSRRRWCVEEPDGASKNPKVGVWRRLLQSKSLYIRPFNTCQRRFPTAFLGHCNRAVRREPVVVQYLRCGKGTADPSASLQILRPESHLGDLPRMSLGSRLIRLRRWRGSRSVARNKTYRPSFGGRPVTALAATGRVHGERRQYLCETSA